MTKKDETESVKVAKIATDILVATMAKEEVWKKYAGPCIHDEVLHEVIRGARYKEKRDLLSRLEGVESVGPYFFRRNKNKDALICGPITSISGLYPTDSYEKRTVGIPLEEKLERIIIIKVEGELRYKGKDRRNPFYYVTLEIKLRLFRPGKNSEWCPHFADVFMVSPQAVYVEGRKIEESSWYVFEGYKGKGEVWTYRAERSRRLPVYVEYG